MKLKRLQSQLDELKKKEAVAQTKEQLLNEEKDQLLSEVNVLLDDVRKLNIIPSEDLTPSNLQAIIEQVEGYIDEELRKSAIPQELL